MRVRAREGSSRVGRDEAELEERRLERSQGSVPSKATYYVSIGDSLAQGFQPIGGPLSPESPPGYNQGYADALFKLTRDRYPQLREVKLGCGGETTTTLRFGGICSYEEGSQLAQGVAFLEEHAREIAFVTIDIGPNDVFSGGGVPAIVQNLPPILAALTMAAGPGVAIVAMNYYDPFAAPVWFQTQSLAALQAEVASTVAFNDLLEGSTERLASRSRTSRARSRSPISRSWTARRSLCCARALGHGHAPAYRWASTFMPTPLATASSRRRSSRSSTTDRGRG